MNSSGGSITSCYNKGDVAGSYSTGGLVGKNYYGTISSSYNEGMVSGDNSIGGLVGYSDSGSITNSYSTGEVTGTTDVGGLVGYSYSGSITDSYGTGSVTGITNVGGLVGENDTGNTITNSYSTGTVSGGSSVGGLVGYNSGTITDCYWDSTTSGTTTGIGSGTDSGATGLTTEEMQQSSSYTDSWDFTDTWRIYDGYSYPLLKTFLTKLTVTADSVTKTYDGTAYTDSLTGVTYSTTIDSSLLLGTLSYGSNKNAGTYSLCGLYSSSQQGYDITYASTSILTINKATLTAALSGTVEKTYDGTTTATLDSDNYTLSGVITGDSVTIANTSGSYADKNAGTGKTVTVTDLTLSGDDASNYTIASSVSGNVGIIDKATLTAALSGTVEKTYDGTTTATLDSDNYTLSGVITGDSVTIANTSGSYADKNAGTSKTVTVTDLTLSGDDASNYTIASNSVSGNVGVIDQAALTITANNVTNTLGDANPNFSATYSALVMGDTIASLDGTLTFSTTATTSSEAGSYVITASGLSSDNYAITYVNGVLTVTDSSNETTWRTEPYNGAVIHADQTSFQGAASKNSGRFSGNAPVTIVDSGINISGYAPLSEQDLPKKPVLEKDKISIEVVNFNTDQDTIPPQNYPILDEVVEMASQHPLWNFRLIGHTDNIGSDENNLDLSWHRAIAVKNYLVSKDVSENRLIIEAKGKSQPLASNETDDDRAKNRRVEIRVK